MKLEFKVNRISNLYSFIANLSQWNELSCLPKRKKRWLQLTGPLNKKEQKTLKVFSRVFQEAKDNIELIFLFTNPEDIWTTLEGKIGKNKTNGIKEVFSMFEPRFNQIWATEESKIKKIIEEFSKLKNTLSKNSKLLARLCKLSNKQYSKKTQVKFILSSGKDDYRGWAFQEDIILECSGWPVRKVEYLINSVFLHETFHILFKRNKKLFKKFIFIAENNNNLILKKFKLWSAKVIFEEALISSFIPEGYLSEKLFHENVLKNARKELGNNKLDNLQKLRNYSALNLYDLAKEYVEENETLDERYFQKVISCIKNFNKK
jgi:hypothetical protein